MKFVSIMLFLCLLVACGEEGRETPLTETAPVSFTHVDGHEDDDLDILNLISDNLEGVLANQDAMKRGIDTNIRLTRDNKTAILNDSQEKYDDLVELIENPNPEMCDLYEDWLGIWSARDVEGFATEYNDDGTFAFLVSDRFNEGEYQIATVGQYWVCSTTTYFKIWFAENDEGEIEMRYDRGNWVLLDNGSVQILTLVSDDETQFTLVREVKKQGGDE